MIFRHNKTKSLCRESGQLMPLRNLYWKWLHGSVFNWNGLFLLYNIYILIEIFEKPWWWLLLCSIPTVNLLFLNWMYDLLVRHYRRSKRINAATFLLDFIFQFLLPVILQTIVFWTTFENG